MNEGLKFGYGLFETILYEENNLMNFDRHMSRLSKSLVVFQMPEINKESIRTKALEVMSVTDDNALRISCYKEANGIKITYETRLSIGKVSYHIKTSAVKRHSNNFLFQHKSSCHLNNYIEKVSIQDTVVDETLHYNENGNLTEGIYTNVFFVKDKVLFTPSIDCGLLPGIMRANVIESAEKLGIPTKIGYYSIETIRSADEVFLTNALIKLVAVNLYDDIRFDVEKNVITQLLMKEVLQ